MRKLLCVAAIVFAIGVGARVQASDAMKAIVTSYLDIQARLAGDKIDGIKPAARAIGEQATRMGAGGDAIVKTSKAIEQAADLKAARDAFGDLSEAVIAAGTAEGWKDVPDLRVAYCPMAKHSWVQKGDAIRNPYYGSTMLTCGSFKK